MKILVALMLIAGAVGWALFGEPVGTQVASASDMPRQISQISR